MWFGSCKIRDGLFCVGVKEEGLSVNGQAGPVKTEVVSGAGFRGGVQRWSGMPQCALRAFCVAEDYDLSRMFRFTPEKDLCSGLLKIPTRSFLSPTAPARVCGALGVWPPSPKRGVQQPLNHGTRVKLGDEAYIPIAPSPLLAPFQPPAPSHLRNGSQTVSPARGQASKAES